MNTSLQIRPARPEDKDAIVSFCQNTFDWGDYIADVWDDWLSDATGGMLVGVVDHRPIAVIHVAVLEGNVAWMEGMRVHPNWRGQAFGTRLDQAARNYARSRGCHLARLATSIDNFPAQQVLSRQGYSRAAQFNSWSTTPTTSHPMRWRIAGAQDLDRLLELCSTFGGTNSPALFPTLHWTWTELTRTRLKQHVDSAEVRLSTEGFAIIVGESDYQWATLTLLALVGDHETLPLLCQDARAEAAYRGFPRVDARIVENARLNRALQSTEFERKGALFIYEQAL